MRSRAVPSLMLLCSFMAFAFPVSARDAPSIKPATVAYNKLMADKIGPIWYRELQSKGQAIAVGTVRIHFRITREGRIEDLKIVSNTSNQALADASIRAIKQAKLPAIPEKVREEQGRNTLEVDLPFTISP